MRLSQFAVLCFPAIVVLGLGCGSSNTGRPKLFPVKGTVTRNGKPVEKAEVSFISPEASRAAVGITDAQGNFVLGTFGNADGAIAGNHIVTVSKIIPNAAPVSNQPPTVEELSRMAAAGMNAPKADLSIPTKYADPKTTPLKASVQGDGQDKFTFDLLD